MRKNKFFTFVFALLPGAGQMYQGFMKRGASLMMTFFALIAIAVILNLEELTIILPVIWFYGFFDCMNKSSYTVEELSMFEDKMVFGFKLDDVEFLNKYTSQKNTFVGWIVILFGILLFYNTIIRNFIWRLEKYLPGIGILASKLPILILSIVIILVGIKLIRGPQIEKVGEEPYEK